jgi:outer membrane protein OmpA-like peptidoglycan-associated protein
MVQIRVLIKILVLSVAFCHYSSVDAKVDTVSVFFAFNESVLTGEARTVIDSAIYVGNISSTQSLAIVGYADAVGADSFNVRLSLRRAGNVKAYLLKSGFQSELITLITGRGEAGAADAVPGGNLRDRRVDIVRVKGGVANEKSNSGPGRIIVTQFPGTTTPTAGIPRKAAVTDIGKLAIGQTLVLDNIYFYAGRHVVRPDSYPALEVLAETLADNPNVKIRIEGHVCCVPAAARDAIDDDTGYEELSVRRALAIREYLVTHGIDPGRLKYAGYGHRQPLVQVERNEEDANQNRRVEIRVIE